MKAKFNKKIATGIMALLLTVSFIPAVAGACRQGRGQGQGGGDCAMKGGGMKGQQRTMLGVWRNPQMVEDLGLSTDQANKLKEADFAVREKHLALKAQLGQLRLQMDRAFFADAVDDKAIMQLAKKKADIKGQMIIQRTEARLIMNKLLTPEQSKKLRQVKMSRKGQRGQLCHQQGGGKGRGGKNRR
jgi:Spy/CpxP family protein refolding chaperone